MIETKLNPRVPFMTAAVRDKKVGERCRNFGAAYITDLCMREAEDLEVVIPFFLCCYIEHLLRKITCFKENLLKHVLIASVQLPFPCFANGKT